jgi:hypothetical protein
MIVKLDLRSSSNGNGSRRSSRFSSSQLDSEARFEGLSRADSDWAVLQMHSIPAEQAPSSNGSLLSQFDKVGDSSSNDGVGSSADNNSIISSSDDSLPAVGRSSGNDGVGSSADNNSSISSSDDSLPADGSSSSGNDSAGSSSRRSSVGDDLASAADQVQQQAQVSSSMPKAELRDGPCGMEQNMPAAASAAAEACA